MRRVWMIIALMPALLAAACATPVDTGPSPIDLVGSWTYAGLDASRLQLAGTFVVGKQTGRTFAGRAELTQRTPGGAVSILSGGVAGRVVDAAAVDFDVAVDQAGTRHHLGRLSGDSISGTWVEADDMGVVSSGTFTLKRSRF